MNKNHYWLSLVLILGLFFSVAELDAKSASGGGSKVDVEAEAAAAAQAEAARQAEIEAQAQARAQAEAEAQAQAQQAAEAEAAREREAQAQAAAQAEAAAAEKARVQAAANAQAEAARQAAAVAAANVKAEAEAQARLADEAAAQAVEAARLAAEEERNAQIAVSVSVEAEAEAENEAEVAVEAEATVCADLDSLRGRITCRLNKTEAELAVELTPENYSPEGCRWGSEAWRENCKTRYRKIHDHYELPIGVERMVAIKTDLGLKAKLEPMSVHCPESRETCKKSYRAKIEHLIVARFYDAEERAEELYELGRLDEASLTELVALVSEAKVAFYDATKSDNRVALQREIILELQAEWNTYMKLTTQ